MYMYTHTYIHTHVRYVQVPSETDIDKPNITY